MSTFIFGHDVVSGISFGYKHYNKKSMLYRIKPGYCFRINKITNNNTTMDADTKFSLGDVMSNHIVISLLIITKSNKAGVTFSNVETITEVISNSDNGMINFS